MLVTLYKTTGNLPLQPNIMSSVKIRWFSSTFQHLGWKENLILLWIFFINLDSNKPFKEPLTISVNLGVLTQIITSLINWLGNYKACTISSRNDNSIVSHAFLMSSFITQVGLTFCLQQCLTKSRHTMISWTINLSWTNAPWFSVIKSGSTCLNLLQNISYLFVQSITTCNRSKFHNRARADNLGIKFNTATFNSLSNLLVLKISRKTSVM